MRGCTDDGSVATIENWLKCARLDAIEWILKTRDVFGFSLQTAYLSVDYFDRFLSVRTIDSGKQWAIQLLSVACLSLAAKMEEHRVPALSEFPVEDYKFESKIIQRMELFVLNTFGWRMGSITPFAYIRYFITKFSEDSRSKALISRAVELILAAAKEINLMDHRPSVIAAAAVLAAYDPQLTEKTMELKMTVIPSCVSLENVNVFSCYNLMLGLEMGRFKIPKFVISPDLSSIFSSTTNAFEDNSFNSASGIKRRRLTFDDCDQNCGKYPMRSNSCRSDP